MPEISKNAAGLLLLVLSLFGLELSVTEVQEFITAVTTIISIALLAWNQFKRTDTYLFFFKKPK